MKFTQKIWGTKCRIWETDTTEIDILYLKKGSFCSTHKHKNKINEFISVSGKVAIETKSGTSILTQNSFLIVKPLKLHRFFVLEDSIMVEIAYVKTGKIDSGDILRYSQGGRVINGREYTEDEIRKKGMLEL